MIKQYYSQIRSKNFSCNLLRKSGDGIGPFPVRSIVRFGSTTDTEFAFPKSYGKYSIIEINTIESIHNSRSKLLMKQCFAEANILQSTWWKNIEEINAALIMGDVNPFPLLAKRIFGFKGKGMVKINNSEELEKFISNTSSTQLSGYYFERFHNFAKEYRLHCTQDECFMSWRKLRKSESKERWFFNSSNCNWVGEDHNLFDKPSNWEKIEEQCCKAIKAVGLDIGAIDLRIQSSVKKNPEFIVIEVNSASALGNRGVDAYKEKIYDLINDKL